MTHMTLGRLRSLLKRWDDQPDTLEVRLFLHMEDDSRETTFGEITAILDPFEEDDTPAYIGLSIADTGDLK